MFSEKQKKQIQPDLNQRLSGKGAGLYLWKLCVSCHLGSARKNHQKNLRDPGGGCAACHLQTHNDSAHPALTVSVDNDRCFGCHSSSGLISLNYVELVETEKFNKKNSANFGRLADNRLVKKRPLDVHSKAGM